MTDSKRDPERDVPFGTGEPERDRMLAARLHMLVGDLPERDVHWPALAARIAHATVRASTPWWSYASRWERRALPLALAAGIAGAFALWRLDAPAALPALPSADLVTAVATGTSTDDAARTFARSVTSASDLSVEVAE